MSKLLRCLIVSACFLAFSTGMLVSVEAQVKDPKKDDIKKVDPKKKDDTKKEMAAGTVEIYKSKSGGFRFRIKDENDKVIAMPPKDFESEEEVRKVLDFLRTTLSKSKGTFVKD